MQRKGNTLSRNCQIENRETFGIDMGGALWATAIHDWNDNKDSYYGLKDKDGKRKEERLYEMLKEHISKGKTVDVFYEAGRYGYAPARIMMELGANVHILPINKLKVIMCGKVIKTDKLDAQFLGGLHSQDDLPEVYIPSIEEESRRDAERELIRLSKSINRVNAQMLALIERTPWETPRMHRTSSNWKKQITQWSKTAIWSQQPKFLLLRLQNMVAELELFEKEIESWDELIKVQEQKDETHSQDSDNSDKTYQVSRKLKQFKSIGDDLSRHFSWEIGDWERFENGKKFASYFGLTPCPFSSGTMNREQGISKAGRKSLRKKAIELGWLWYRWQKDSWLVKNGKIILLRKDE